MKTSFKRFAALALAAVMVLGTMNLSAFADTAVGNRTLDSALVISGLEDGDIVRFYRVLEPTQDSWDYNDSGWIYTSDFIKMSTNEGVQVPTLVGNPGGDPVVPMSVTASRAGKIARLVATENATPTYTETATGGKAVHGNPAPGMYVAIITPINKDVVYNPVFVSADYVQDNQNPASSEFEVKKSVSSYADSAAAKKSTLTINKSASTSEDSWDDGGQNKENSQFTTAIGDTVSFFVNTTIPAYGEVYENPMFEVTDTLENLELKTGTVKVYAADNEGNKVGDAYTTQCTIDPKKAGYTITFDEGFLKGLKAPQNIRIEYEAIVTTDAAQNVNVENNTVQIKYSTNPTHSSDSIPKSSGDFAVKKDETNHYTFTIDANSLFGGTEYAGKSGSEVVKVGVGPDGKPITQSKTTSQIEGSHSVSGVLEGAKFKLYTAPIFDDDHEYIPKSADGTKGTKGLDLVSGPDGRFTIPGLDAGTYYLKETEAPAGFIKDQGYHTIVIDKVIEEEWITEWYFDDDWYDTKEKANAVAEAAGKALPDGKDLREGVYEWKYQTDILKSYSITIDGVPTATHTFEHSSASSVIKWSSTGHKELPYSIKNTQGVELPSTGGVGTTIFYAGGALLVLLAGVLLVSKRRIA